MRTADLEQLKDGWNNDVITVEKHTLLVLLVKEMGSKLMKNPEPEAVERRSGKITADRGLERITQSQ